jgi:hypothetical protein
MSEDTYLTQRSGARITQLLNDPSVSWPIQDRSIETGDSILTEDVIPAETNALTYLQSIEVSEPGQLFIGKDGSLTFLERNSPTAMTGIIFADDGTGIKYTNLQVTYGSELLYNEVIANSSLLSLTSTKTDTESQTSYGISSLTVDTLLDSQSELDNYATYLVGQYAEPEYRFEALQIDLLAQSDSVKDSLLGLELGQVAQVIFTPNNIPPAIQKYARIVGIEHSVSPEAHQVVFRFATIDTLGFTLDSPALGRLEVNRLAW